MDHLYRRFKHLYRDTNFWTIATIVLTVVIAIPLWIIGLYVWEGVGEMWNHIIRYFLLDYLFNSAYLLLGTGLLSILFGLGSAWIVTQYDFPGRSFLEGLLFLPLAIPSYIVAYAYVGLLGNGGTLMGILNAVGIPLRRIEMMNIWGLIWVLSVSLYPYVYAATRAIFLHYPSSLRETAYLLGASEARYRREIAFPLAAPAVIGGLFLVYMEVFNDYGAAKYYGINTFTTGIFRTWTALEDLQSAVYLCAILLLVVFALLGLVRWWQGRRSFTLRLTADRPDQKKRQRLQGRYAGGAMMMVLIPIVAGFLLPVAQLLYWAALSFAKQWNVDLLWLGMQSCTLALATGALTVSTALLLLYISGWNHWKPIKQWSKLATVGYVLPGAIIGISIIRSSQGIINFFDQQYDLAVGYLFYGSSAILLYAYVFRFLSVAFQPLAANLLKQGKHLRESAILLGASKWRTFWRVEMPLLRPAIISTFLLVFIDVMKELPLTLILKPYDVQTLAIKAYEYADDERVAEAALPALILVGISGLLLTFLKKK